MKNIITKFLLLWVVAFMAIPASAQQRRISGTVSDDIDVVIGANVKEIDKNNRIVSQAITDMNGNFTMNIKDPNNTLEVTYIGYRKFSQKIGSGKSVFKITLQDNTKTMQEVTITKKKMAPTTTKEGMPEDESKDGETQAQKLLEKFSKAIDAAFEKKEKEIMTV